jgi:hypothetical protein
MGVIHIDKESGVKLSHEIEALPIIRGLLLEFQPELMIELGTLKGGFTYQLHKTLPDVELHTYDIKHVVAHKRIAHMFNENVSFHIADIQSIPLDELINLCRQPAKKMLYCDNGDKTKELNMYAKHLNSGDLLGCHDWGTEVFFEDVEDVLKNFYRHKVNKELKDENCMSRFWIRR